METLPLKQFFYERGIDESYKDLKGVHSYATLMQYSILFAMHVSSVCVH